MIVEVVAGSSALALLGSYLENRRSVVLEARRRRERYAACLRSIDRLERELFPQWFAKPSLERTNHVQVIPGAYSLSAVPARADEVIPWLRDHEHITVHALDAYLGLPLGEARRLLALEGLRVEPVGVRVGELRRLVRNAGLH